MPYKLEKTGTKYFVVDDKGKKYSDKPMSKWQATRQMRALYSAEKKQFIKHTGSMVALPLSDAIELVQGLSFPEGSEILPPHEMHVTLAFLGDVSGGSVDPEKLFAVVEKFAASQSPVIGKINGYGVFTETHIEDKQCFWLSLDAPTLPRMRQDLAKTLEENGFAPENNHGFTPHITVAYVPKDWTLPAINFDPVSVMILYLRVAWAELVRDFPFGVIASKELSLETMASNIRNAVYQALMPSDQLNKPSDPWVRDVYDTYVIVEAGGACYQVDYIYDYETGAVQFSNPVQVEQAWVPTGKAIKSYGDRPKADEREKGFRTFKQADGSYRWLLISSSAFRDRDGEIVTEKALSEDVVRCDETGEYGPLRWWHMGEYEYPDGPLNWKTWKAGPGVDLGTCDFNMLHGKMLIESGTFKDAEIGEAFSNWKEPLEASILFSHPLNEPNKSKEFANIHRLERSLLPAGMASNLLTKLYVSKGESTMKLEKKLAALVAIFKDKPDVAAQILADAAAIQKAAESVGLESKEVGDMLSVQEGDASLETPPVDETPPVTEPVTEPVTVPEPAGKEGDEGKEGMEEDMIGDMTPKALTEFVTGIVKQLLGEKAHEAESKQAGLEQLLADAVSSVKLLADRTAVVEKTTAESKQVLLDLTDARPIGIKQLQNSRPTEREENVIQTAPQGPHIDDNFVKFSQGGNGNA